MLPSLALSIGSLLLVNGQQASQAVFNSESGRNVITDFSKSASCREIFNSLNIHGLSLAVVSRDGDPEFCACGNRTEEGDPMTSKTLFHLASCSKAFLATAFGILMEDFAVGKNTTALPQGLTTFDWNTKVKDIMPASSDWSLMDEWAYEKANIRDILSHVSGLPPHDFSVGREDRIEDVVSRMKFLRPAFELREQWLYNNLMFMASAHIISHYTGSYTSFVRDRIFIPLNMSSTTFFPSEAVRSGKMSHSWTRNGRRIPQWFTDDLVDLTAGPGGIISSAEDMAKWVKTLLNSGVDASTNVTIIPRSVFDEITTAHVIVEGKPWTSGQLISGYGMGWERGSHQGHDVWHSGGIPGFSTLVSFLPLDALGVIVLINGDGKESVADTVTNQVFDAMLGIKPDSMPPPTTPPLECPQEPSAGAPKTPIALDKYTGTYRNPAYGSITFCDSTNPQNSSYCTQVLSDFATVDSHKPSQIPSYFQLFAKWSRIWSTHVRLVYISDSGSGRQFGIQPTALFTSGFGADKTPFETFESGAGEVVAEFVLVNGRVLGLGVQGIVGDLSERRGSTIQEKADVWFDKIDDME